MLKVNDLPKIPPSQMRYSRALGDQLNAFHVWFNFRGADPSKVCNYFEDVVQIMGKFNLYTNAARLVLYSTGGWENNPQTGLPFYYEEPGNPDITASFSGGFTRFRRLICDAATRFNANICVYLDPYMIGPATVQAGLIPENQKALDEKGQWKKSWEFADGTVFYALSLFNRIHSSSKDPNRVDPNSIDPANPEWRMLDGYVQDFGLDFGVFADAYMHWSKNGLNINREVDPKTTYDQEKQAGLDEINYLWEKHGIASATEFSYAEFIDPDYHGREDVYSNLSTLGVKQPTIHTIFGCEFVAPAINLSEPEDYLNVWGNSVIYIHRKIEDWKTLLPTVDEKARIYAWGSVLGGNFNNPCENAMPTDEYATETAHVARLFYQHCVQYLYMQKFKPYHQQENEQQCRVDFLMEDLRRNGEHLYLESTFCKTDHSYLLKQVNPQAGGREIVLAEGSMDDAVMDYTRFVPHVGAGCRIYVYSTRARACKRFLLPETWSGVVLVDCYSLSFDSKPRFTASVPVDSNQLFLSLDLEPRTPYVLVPHGHKPTPVTVTFAFDSESGAPLDHGCSLAVHGGVIFNEPGNDAATVHLAGKAPDDPESSTGVFCSQSWRFEAKSYRASERIRLPSGAVLHSVRVGTLAGAGNITLESSNSANASVGIPLPRAGASALLETDWIHPEAGAFLLKISNDAGARNVVLNYLVYS